MKTTRLFWMLGVMAVATTGSARADVKDFLTRCTPGAVRACWSMTVMTTLNGSGGTNVTILVRNLQGDASGYDNTGGSLISRIGLVTPAISGASGLTVSTLSGTGVVGTPASSWTMRNPGGLGGLIELTAGTGFPRSMDGGIAGCDAPYPGYPGSYFSTCNGGWVQLTFTTSNAWSANSAEVAVLVTNAQNPQNFGYECDTDNLPTPRPECTVATPEPVTMLLLGSGLAGMGGFGLVRRRKGTDVTNA